MEIEILKDWKEIFNGELSENTVTFDNRIAVGKIEGFIHQEYIHVLRFDFEMRGQKSFGGNDFEGEDNFIPIFFEEPYSNSAAEMDLLKEEMEKRDFKINGVFTTNNLENLWWDFNPKKRIRFVSVRLKKDYFFTYVKKSSYLSSIFKEDEPFYVIDHFTPLLGSLFLRSFEITSETLFRNEMMHSVGIHLIAVFFEKLSERAMLNENNNYSFSTQPVLKARSLLNTRWDKGLTIDVLARECGLSASRLRALFKETFGITIHKYHNDVKLEAARSMLLEGRKSIYMIAAELSFSSTSHFITSFRKKFDITPKEYQLKNNKD